MDFRLMNESEIRCWYTAELCTAFVPQECKPLADIFHLLAENRYEIWGLFEDSLLLGYAALWKSPEVPLILLDYLGVTAARRNAGLGAAILALLKAQGRSLILESVFRTLTPWPPAAWRGRPCSLTRPMRRWRTFSVGIVPSTAPRAVM